jgi:signal transduction histidine kinase
MEIVLDFRRPPASPPCELLQCFQAALGHELPNQLVAVHGLARLLGDQHGQGLNAEGHGLLDRLTAAVSRADHLVRRLAEIGRLCCEVDAPEPGEAAVGLADAAREAVAAVNLMYPGRELHYDGGEGLPFFRVSRRALHKVLVELLSNAVQACPPGPSPPVEIGGAVAAGGREFWVRDRGRGIGSGEADRLFQPFLSRSTPAGPVKGGLGLFLVRQVVARWGGVLRLRSEEGPGTDVTVFVPERGKSS